MKNFEHGAPVLALMRDRISKQKCPICGVAIKAGEPVTEYIDEYITKEIIKVCKTHHIDSKLQ